MILQNILKFSRYFEGVKKPQDYQNSGSHCDRLSYFTPPISLRHQTTEIISTNSSPMHTYLLADGSKTVIILSAPSPPFSENRLRTFAPIKIESYSAPWFDVHSTHWVACHQMVNKIKQLPHKRAHVARVSSHPLHAVSHIPATILRPRRRSHPLCTPCTRVSMQSISTSSACKIKPTHSAASLLNDKKIRSNFLGWRSLAEKKGASLQGGGAPKKDIKSRCTRSSNYPSTWT